ncbi:MAG TPA: hypothetical protein VFV05_01565 [Methylomirabilota bacterium]|nr:hypothetical protein [Methylomirabilota bacterium]
MRFAAASYTVSEVSPALTVTVLRTGPMAGTVTVDCAGRKEFEGGPSLG